MPHEPGPPHHHTPPRGPGRPRPPRTVHPRAKEAERARARQLRLQGWTYARIRDELGVSLGSVSGRVRGHPTPPPTRSTREQARLAHGPAGTAPAPFARPNAAAPSPAPTAESAP